MRPEGGSWLIVDPDGVETTLRGSLGDVCDQHERAACILTGCPDAFGWTLTDLETGRVNVPERVDEMIRAHLG